MASLSRRSNKDGSITLRVRWGVPPTEGRTRERLEKTFIIPAGATKKQAREIDNEAAQFRRDIERDGGAESYAAGRVTVAELAERFLAAKAQRREGSTVRRYRADLSRSILVVFGHRPVGAVGAIEVERWLAGRLVSGLAANTVKGEWALLRALFKDAVRKRMIQWNPCDGVEPPPGGRSLTRTLTRGEEAGFLVAIAGDPLEALWRVLLYGGLRVAEAVVLRWGDLNGDWLTVGRTETRGDGGAVAREGTKTHATRRVLLDRETVAAFDRARPEWALPSAPCFPGKGRTHIGTNGVQQRMKRLVRAAGLPDDITPHVLRRTNITRMSEAGMPYRVIGERVGHRSLAITMQYDNPDEEAQRRAMRGLVED